jgi:AbrB family looped-hinge helix DNA binding protein
MEKTRLSSKGQVILPRSIRRAHDWLPGTEFSVESVEDGVLLRPLKPFAPTRVEDVFGCLRGEGPAKTVEEIDAAIGAGVRKRRASGRC